MAGSQWTALEKAIVIYGDKRCFSNSAVRDFLQLAHRRLAALPDLRPEHAGNAQKGPRPVQPRAAMDRKRGTHVVR